MKAYSLDLRERVLQAVDQGESEGCITKIFKLVKINRVIAATTNSFRETGTFLLVLPLFKCRIYSFFDQLKIFATQSLVGSFSLVR